MASNTSSILLGPIIADIDFGSDVAEHDELLQACFVETDSFQSLITDRVDVILGPKGSGKSALFHRLTNPNSSIAKEIDMLAAFNVQGSPIFQHLVQADPSPTESDLRRAWWWYSLALVGNHLVESIPSAPQTPALRDSLRSAGLLATSGRPGSVWSKLMDRLPRIQEIGLGTTVGPEGRTGVTARLKLGRRPPGSPNVDAHQFEPLLKLEHEILESADRQCWLLFDRLDESFMDSREIERRALRGLLRAHLELSSYGMRVKSKLFLRTDVMSRITAQEGFTNLTHLRDHRIAWDEDSIRELVANRAVASRQFRAKLLRDRSVDRGVVCKRLFPEKMRVGGQGWPGFRWVVRFTTDGTGHLNPRNVLTLVRDASRQQAAMCQLDNPSISMAGPVLSARALTASWTGLSERRLQDTLFAEANHLRPWIERFSYQPPIHDARGVAEILGMKATSDEFGQTLADLRDVGLLERTGPNRFKVAELYRAALNTAPHPGIREKEHGKAQQLDRRQRSAKSQKSK